MTIEELKKEYEAKAEELHNKAMKESKRAELYNGFRGLYEEGTTNYNNCVEIATEAFEKSRELFEKATIYYKVLLDLLKVTK